MGAAGCGIPAKLIWDLAAADGANCNPKPNCLAPAVYVQVLMGCANPLRNLEPE